MCFLNCGTLRLMTLDYRAKLCVLGSSSVKPVQHDIVAQAYSRSQPAHRNGLAQSIGHWATAAPVLGLVTRTARSAQAVSEREARNRAILCVVGTVCMYRASSKAKCSTFRLSHRARTEHVPPSPAGGRAGKVTLLCWLQSICKRSEARWCTYWRLSLCASHLRVCIRETRLVSQMSGAGRSRFDYHGPAPQIASHPS